MVDFGSGALKIGQAIATGVLSIWFNRRKLRKERGRELIQIAAGEFVLPLQEAKLNHLVAGVANQVAEQLEPMFRHEFRSMEQNDINAALDGVASALETVGVDDDRLMESDLRPDELARRVRDTTSTNKRTLYLSEQGNELYDLALDQSCKFVSRIVMQLPAFQGRALAEILSRLSAHTSDLHELLARTPRTRLDAPRGTQHDLEFEREYFEHLDNKLNRLELLGLSMRNRPQLSLSVAYLSLQSRSPTGDRSYPKFERRDLASKSKWFSLSSSAHSAQSQNRTESAIGKFKRVLVRGEAGSGKTTLLNWVAVNCASSSFAEAMGEWNGIVPFPIRLRAFAYTDLPSPENFVSHMAPTLGGIVPEGWVHRVLRSGRAVLLIDGVDEVPRRRRSMVKSWVNEILTTFPDIRVVISSRPAAAEFDWLESEHFSCTDLEQMSPSDVRTFLRRWHEAAAQTSVLPCDPSEIPAAETRLLAQLDNRLHLQSIATNPLLCAMLCALNLTSAAELPQSRMGLYRAALDMLLDLRDAEREIPTILSSIEKTVILRDLAWRLTQNNRVELARADVEDFVSQKIQSMPNVDEAADEVTDHLLERSGVVREPIPGRVDFVHRTFQEYLAASEATEQKHLGVLIEHAHLDQWRETIVMASGHAKRPQIEELLTGILDRAESEPRNARRLRVLAAACLETTPDMPTHVRARVDACISTYLVPPRSVRETQSLAPVGHRLLRHLPLHLDDLSEASAAATVRAATLTGDNSAFERLSRYARDKRIRVQEELISGWRYFDPQRYVDEVLADAPLVDGSVSISTGRQVPFLSRLQNLKSLHLTVVGEISKDELVQVPALKSVAISALDFSLHDLPSQLPIDELDVYYSSDTDLGPSHFSHLSEMSGITRLSFHDSRISGTQGIEKLERLESLSLRSVNSKSNIDSVRYLPNLRSLTVFGWKAKPCKDFFVGLNKLRSLSAFRAVWLREFRQLEGALEQLEYVLVDDCAIESLVGLRASSLLYLSLTRNPINEISPLSDAAALGTLYIDETGVKDLTPLAGKKVNVWVSADQTPLAGVEKLGSGSKVRVYGQD